MSTMSNMNYEIFRAENYKPEWITNERYEYCEGFYESLKNRDQNILKSLKRFASALHQFLL